MKPRAPAARTRQAGFVLAVCLVGFAIVGQYLTPNNPSRQFGEFVLAPPMRPHVIDGDGHFRRPFVYPLRLENRLEQRYAKDRTRPMPLRLFANGALLSIDPVSDAPWFPLGTDALGRDQLSRLALGTGLSLGVAVCAALGALVIGALLGGLSGFVGGSIDDLVMRVADVLIALPALYVVLALRASMPLVLSTGQIFWTMVVVLAVVGWPWPARGVRAVVAAERVREYAEAARALGAGRTRLLLVHLLPAARGFLVTQATLLIPAFILAEATLSFVGLGFSEPIPSWGAMLRDAGHGRTVFDAPWLLAPALGIVCSALAVNLSLAETAHASAQQNSNRP